MDDQRADALGCAGDPDVKTPNIDRLAEEGTRFANCFVTTPICTPGRAELLTGCDSFQNGVPYFEYPIDASRTLMSTAFHEAGYDTLYVGKWHNDGHPAARGFSETRRVMQDSVDWEGGAAASGHMLAFVEEDRLVSGHGTDLFADAVEAWIEARADGDPPWFAYLAFHSPHDPFTPPPEFAALYQHDDLAVPDSFSPVPAADSGDLTIRDEQLLPWPRTPDAVRQYRAGYFGMISHHDHRIGTIVAALRATGQLDDTIIAFTSDHGLAVGSHGLLGKSNMYDHSVRVPFIAMGPGVPRGQVQDDLCRNTDIFPTLCALAGVPIPETVEDGHDLMRSDSAAGSPFRDRVFSQFSSPHDDGRSVGNYPLVPTQRMIRTDRWKLIFYPRSKHYELFDLRSDPVESLDLLADWRWRRYVWVPSPRDGGTYEPPERDILAVAAELRALLIAHARDSGDSVLDDIVSAPIRVADDGAR